MSMRSMLVTFLSCIVMLGWTPTGRAAVESLTFGGGSNGPLPSGTHSWNTPGNWTSDDVPDEFVTTGTGESAVIGDATGDRTVTTSAPLVFHDLQWSQSTGGGVVNRIQLGANWNARTNQNVITNTTGSAAAMVFDVNGFQADFNSSALQMGGWLVTWTSSAPGGLITNDTIGLHASAVVGPNLTLQPNSTGGSRLQGAWDISATFRSRPGSATSRFDWIKGAGIGNIIVGDGVNAHLMTWGTDPNSPAQVINGNVTVTQNARWVFGANSSGSKFVVGGNFIDPNNDALGYGGNSANGDILVFALNPMTPRTVSIARTGLTNNIQVGSNITGTGHGTKGDIVLGHDLTTTGTFAVLAGSKLDVDAYTLATGAFTAGSGAIFEYTAGSDTGVINVTDLTLNAFTLNIQRLGTWDYAHDLVLFNYTGTLTGAPSLTLGVTPGGFAFDLLLTDGGVVRLTNVVLPEPSAAACVATTVVLLTHGRRRRGARV